MSSWHNVIFGSYSILPELWMIQNVKKNMKYVEERTSQAKVLPNVVNVKVARTLHTLEMQNISINSKLCEVWLL